MEAQRFELAAMATFPSKVEWDASAADLVSTMLARWNLTPGEAFTGGEAGAAIAVRTASGDDAVLKVGFPHAEAVAEALGLAYWSPLLAPRVLRQDVWTWALLLERVEPGIPLSRAPLATPEALESASQLLARLHGTRAPAGVPSITDIVGGWLTNAQAGSRLDIPSADRDRVYSALTDARMLLDGDQGRAFLHGDANPGNILWDEPANVWKAIDPKPMIGDPEFDVHPLIEQTGGTAADARVLEQRMVSVVRELELDADKTLRWCIARCGLTVVWAGDDRDVLALRTARRQLAAWNEISGA